MRERTQRSAESLKTRSPRVPTGRDARQVLPVPGVPAGGASHTNAARAQPAPEQHSSSAVQRQNPASHTPERHSDASAQRSPAKSGSVLRGPSPKPEQSTPVSAEPQL